MTAEVDVAIVSDPRCLHLVRAVARAFCTEFDAQGDASRALVSALDEALSNVIRHGYRGDRSQPIRIACRCDGESFRFEVRDRAEAFDPLAHSVPPPDELRAGGRGIFLMCSSMDACEYERSGGWNRLRLTKLLPRPRGRA